MAQEAEWQKNPGQYFLHEMMHLNSTGQPHINDERVSEDGIGPWAYAPRLVHKLAIRNLNKGGGAARASTNADSYAWLTNSKYFWDLTGYFPAPPKYRDEGNIDNISFDEEARAQDVWPLHLGVINQDTSEEEVQSRYNTEVESMGTKPWPRHHRRLHHLTQPSRRPIAQTRPPIHDLPGTSDKLWLALMYTNEACSGFFQFTLGANDDEKREHCRSRFRTVLNGCQTDTITEKKGGSLKDVCAVYTITTAKEGEDPFSHENWYKDQGEFKCEEVEVLGKKECECYYSGYRDITDLFNMPGSGNCNDVDRTDLVNNN